MEAIKRKLKNQKTETKKIKTNCYDKTETRKREIGNEKTETRKLEN